MKIQRLDAIPATELKRIMYRSSGINEAIYPQIKIKMDLVKNSGDFYLMEKYEKKFGKDKYPAIQVTKEEVKKAYKDVDSKTIIALKQMIKNITAVQRAQLPRKKDRVVRCEKGIKVWREWRAIEKVGLYIPGGKAIYPSSVLMTGIPAKIAGCKEIIMCSPPKENGQIPAAKSIAQKFISIDMPAGPSEVFIIADETANPAFIAADLLADGEHGEDSACVLVTTSEKIARQTVLELEKQLLGLSTRDRAEASLKKYSLIALVDFVEEAVQFSNEYAPEHLELMIKNADAVVSKINNAGSVFVGNWTSKSSGDYATGANHVLPTGGMAKMYPPLGVDAFGKWMQVQTCTKLGLQTIKKTIETIAEVEQLPAHKESVSIRFK